MIARCVTSRGKERSSGYRGVYYTERTVFHVTQGQEYYVHGVSVYNGGVQFLLYDDVRLPNWYPAELFELTDGRLSPDWMFASFGEGEPLQALMGYELLIEDEQHYDALLERNSDALGIFLSEVSRKGNAL